MLKYFLIAFTTLFSYEGYTMPMTVQIKEALAKKAVEARTYAYAPYSNFKVGAALLTANGSIYKGCNVENASYGLSCCAERTAIFRAIADGQHDFIAMAIVVPGGGTPCGACRQVLNEFNPQLPIIFADEYGKISGEITLGELLPHAFGPHNLKQSKH